MEQIQSIRLIFITKDRNIAMEDMHESLIGDQIMFGTSFSYQVHQLYYDIKYDLSRMRNWKAKFNLLFSFTYTIYDYNFWMRDNEGDMNNMVLGLAKTWKAMLKRSDYELGIDAQYTRPGVIAMLESFKEEIEASTKIPLQFLIGKM